MDVYSMSWRPNALRGTRSHDPCSNVTNKAFLGRIHRDTTCYVSFNTTHSNEMPGHGPRFHVDTDVQGLYKKAPHPEQSTTYTITSLLCMSCTPSTRGVERTLPQSASGPASPSLISLGICCESWR